MHDLTIGEFSPFSYGRGLPESKRTPGDIPVYGSNGIVGYHDEAITKGPTVVIGRKGTVGAVQFSPVPCWPIDTTFFTAFEGLDQARFAYYVLKSAGLEQMNSDSAVPGLNRDAAHARQLSLATQDSWLSIARILGALDDKIERNRKTAAVLDRLARAIFRAWFEDFEPVKAKAAGAESFPCMPQHVFDALPARFVDSEIGPVPEGWEIEEIGNVATIKGGSTPSTKNPAYWDGGEHCWATPRDMSRLSHPVLLDTERHITDTGVNRTSSGLLPVGTVLLSSRAPVGYVAIAGVPTAINQGFIAMVCDGPLPPCFVLNWVHRSMEAIKARASGTTFPEISKKNFRPLPVIKPTGDVISAYGQVVEPLFDLLTAGARENVSLAGVRDYILPRLLSGQVRVATAVAQDDEREDEGG